MPIPTPVVREFVPLSQISEDLKTRSIKRCPFFLQGKYTNEASPYSACGSCNSVCPSLRPKWLAHGWIQSFENEQLASRRDCHSPNLSNYSYEYIWGSLENW